MSTECHQAQRPTTAACSWSIPHIPTFLTTAQIASLPHIELEFVSPGTGKRHSSLFLVDTGAGGTEMMFHSRAARELQLLRDERRMEQDAAMGRKDVSGVG
jgi:hypothetical protein